MDKFEYNIKVEKMKKLVGKKDFETAAEIADSIDWHRIKNTRMLFIVSMIYERNHRYKDAKDILLLSYDQSSGGRRQLYKLTELSAKEHNFEDAAMFYKKYAELEPSDLALYPLKYRILSEQGAPLDQQIAVLEAYKDRELDERWGFELAKLYHKAGRKEDCVNLCDEIILWFSVGSYVEHAAELKAHYEPLTPDQEEKVMNQDKYEEYVRQAAQECEIQVEKNIEEAEALRQAVETAQAIAAKALEAEKRESGTEETGTSAEEMGRREAVAEAAATAFSEENMEIDMTVEGEGEGDAGAGDAVEPLEAYEMDGSLTGILEIGEPDMAAEMKGNVEDGAGAAGMKENTGTAAGAAGEIENTRIAAGAAREIENAKTAAGAARVEESAETESGFSGIEGRAAITEDGEEERFPDYNLADLYDSDYNSDYDPDYRLGTEAEKEEKIPLEENVMYNSWEEEVTQVLSIFNREQEEDAQEGMEERPSQDAMVPGLLYVAVSSVEEGLGQATEAIKELHKLRGDKAEKVAKVSSERLNVLGLKESLKKLKGADLIILEANTLSDRCLAEILWLTQKAPMQLIIVFMDTEDQIESLDARAGELMVNVLCRIEQEERAKKAARKVLIKPMMMPDMAVVEAKIELSEHEMEAAATEETPQEEEGPTLLDLDIQIPADLGLEYSVRPKMIDQEQVKANLVSVAEAMVQEGPVPTQQPQNYQESQGYQGTQTYQNSRNYQGSWNAQEPQGYQAPQGYQGAWHPQDSQNHQGSWDYQSHQGYQAPNNYQESQSAQDSQNYKGSPGYQEAEKENRELSSTDFVDRIKEYADDLDCTVDDLAGLAVHALADKYSEEGIPLTERLAKEVTEAAVIRADKKGIGGLFASKYDKEGRLILKESHFKMKVK